MGSGVLAVACRMDADTPAAHALYHLSYIRRGFFQKLIYYNGFSGKLQGLRWIGGRALVIFSDL